MVIRMIKMMIAVVTHNRYPVNVIQSLGVLIDPHDDKRMNEICSVRQAT